MARTQVTGRQTLDNSIQRDDLDSITAGEAVIKKALSGASMEQVSTGVDNGTGDVTYGIAGVGIVCSQSISNGDLLNIYDVGSGVFNVRKADASSANKFQADGYCLVGGASGATIKVYGFGVNNVVSGLVPGERFLSATTPGASVTATVAGAYSGGQLVQKVGIAQSATVLQFTKGEVLVTL